MLLLLLPSREVCQRGATGLQVCRRFDFNLCVGAGLKDRFRTVIRTLWPPYSGGEYSLGCCDVCCLISLVIPLVCGSVNERVDCIISSILSLALPLGRLAVDVLDKIAGIFSVSPVVLRGGVLDRLTSFAACRNLIFPAVDESIEWWGLFHIPCYFRGRRWTA